MEALPTQGYPPILETSHSGSPNLNGTMHTLATLTTREILHDFCPDRGSTYMDIPVKPPVKPHLHVILEVYLTYPHHIEAQYRVGTTSLILGIIPSAPYKRQTLSYP